MKNKNNSLLKTNKTNLLKYFMLLPIIALILTHTLTFSQLSKKNILLANTNWTTYAANSYDSGTGTSSNPYIIKTAEQLARVAKQVNSGNDRSSFFKLANYIDLKKYNWVPIGNSSSYTFLGNFDGAGNAILNIKNTVNTSYNGLFGRINSAVVKNIFLISGSLNSTNDYLGSAIGYAYNSTVEKIYSTVTITNNKSASKTGGIIGFAESSTLSKFVNKANVTANSSNATGGLIGAMQTTGLSYSYNEGIVSGSDNTGGIAGTSYGAVSLQQAYNIGSVSGANQVGGIVGDASELNIQNVFNEGSVTSTGGNIGGIVGKAYKLTINQAYNNKNITANNGMNVGGIVGNASTNTTISNSHNAGSVSAGNRNVGGIVGYAENSGSISNSLNTGSVTSNSSENATTGGIIGYVRFENSSTYTIEKNGNTGHIKAINASSGYSSLVGGIIGYIYNNSVVEPTLNILRNYNSGKVEGKYSVGGFIGGTSRGLDFVDGKDPDIYYPTRIVVDYNSNIGAMRGDTYVGGFIGEFLAEDVTNITFSNNYYGGYVEREFNKEYHNIGSFSGRDVYHEYKWSRASNNYFVYDIHISDFFRSTEVLPIGDYSNFGGGFPHVVIKGGIENYINGIIIFSSNYLNSEEIRSSLGSQFHIHSGRIMPIEARKTLIEKNLNQSTFIYSHPYANGNYPIIKDFYWSENAAEDSQAQIYNITINTNGGSSIANKTYTVSSSSQNIYLGSPTKSGYNFSNWSIVGASNGASISGNYLYLPARFSSNISVIANWVEKPPSLSYTIVPSSTMFASNGGPVKITITSGSGTITTSNVSTGIGNVRISGNVINFDILSMPSDARVSRLLSITINRPGSDSVTITFTQSTLGFAEIW